MRLIVGTGTEVEPRRVSEAIFILGAIITYRKKVWMITILREYKKIEDLDVRKCLKT